MSDLVFIRLTTVPSVNQDPEAIVVNLRNIRAVTERHDHTVVETSAESVGVIRVVDTWDQIGNQVQRGGCLRHNEEEST